MNDGLQDACNQKDVRQRIGDSGLARHLGNEHQATEDGQVLDAVGMRPCEALHEGGKIGVVWIEPVCRNGFGQDEPGAYDLHEHQEKQRPGNESSEGGEGGVHTVIPGWWVSGESLARSVWMTRNV